MAEPTPVNEARRAPDFGVALIMAIELIKRGAQTVDLHEWNLRLEALGTEWDIGSIPAHAHDRYEEGRLALALAYQTQTPIAGEEAPYDPDAAPEVGLASSDT